MEDYETTTTTDLQGLYNDIEHLIDVPFDQFTKDVEQKIPEETPQENYAFERPILIESDNDDIEEELWTPDQAHYTMSTCYRCNKPIPSLQSSSLQLVASELNVANICADCLNRKRTRSRSFTLDGNNVLTQFADKLKQSFGSNSLLSPSKTVNRRKSMPSMNSTFTEQSLDVPSPTPSRPSSRASSFIEDVKQFLSPLSRKSNQTPDGPKKKTSHSSLFDAINLCKPKQKQNTTPSYERRIIGLLEDDTTWAQEDSEVFGIHQKQYHQQNQDPLVSNTYIPLRRKQIKQIESRQERMNVYNNAYIECMELQTDLVPWIVKQTQKGPPDAWFGYVPPPREPKKFMGLFKRKSKQVDGNNLRAQQLQLGDELLSRTTPLLNRQYSNSQLSVSPGAQSPLYDLQADFATSPVSQQPDIEDESIHSPYKPDPIQPVSILKKKPSSRHVYPQENSFEDYGPEEIEDMYHEAPYNQQKPHRPTHAVEDYYYHHENVRGRKHSGSYRMAEQEHVNPPRRRQSYRSLEQDHRPVYEKESRYYREPHRSSRRRRDSFYEHYDHEEEVPYDYFDLPAHPVRPPSSRRVSPARNYASRLDYYSSAAKQNPYMMEEWEATLDDLCDLFPRMDRHYINEFLMSAQGDFFIAKSMIMEMIMKMP
ncbi:hypothetical protein CU098_010882 [Rhizopus stolonifer]|uniref:CUE domain-containing protein n=1 Tax=Rhizopus stolonifer TaxID=4846 RepID=A0A367KSV6_RHIST|nr:hypothetical protein CU098_010882 [Rhizopus stolonifer]